MSKKSEKFNLNITSKIQNFKNIKSIVDHLKHNGNPSVKLATLKSLKNMDYPQSSMRKRRNKVMSQSPTKVHELFNTLQNALKKQPEKEYSMAINSL